MFYNFTSNHIFVRHLLPLKGVQFFSKLHAYHSPRDIRNCTHTKQLRRPLMSHIKLHPSSTSTISNRSWLLCVHNPCAALLDSWMSVTTSCFHPNAFCLITEQHQYSLTLTVKCAHCILHCLKFGNHRLGLQCRVQYTRWSIVKYVPIAHNTSGV